MKKILLYILLFFSAQTFGQTTFQKTFGGTNDDNAWDICMTNDSGYVMVGYTWSFGTPDVYLIKVNSGGSIQWTKTYGGTNIDAGGAVRQTSDSGFIIAGFSRSYSSGDYDAYLIKTDWVGNVLWKRLYGGVGQDGASSVEQTGDGGYILAGYTYSNSFGINDVFLIKTDMNGDTLWTRIYGGTGGDPANCVVHTSDGGYILAGWSQSYGLGNNGQACLLKIDANGDTVWTKTYGGAFTDAFRHVLETSDNGYIATGYTNISSGGGSDIFVVRTNALGDTLWTRIYGSSALDEQAEEIHLTSDGGYIIVGFEGSAVNPIINNACLVKIDSVGNLLWARSFGDTLQDEGHSVLEVSDKGFIVAGLTSSFGSGGKDVYLIKTDSVGISGCHETNSNIIEGIKTITVESQAPLISSGTIVLNPNISIGNGGAVTILCPVTPSVNEITQEATVTVYPNPSNGIFKIEMEDVTGQMADGDIEVYNSLGKLVFSSELHTTTYTLDLRSKSKGIYFIKVITDDRVYSQKVIIE